MNDIESKIESILSDPDALKQIEALSKSLGLADNSPEPVNHQHEKDKKLDLSTLTSILQPKSNSPQPDSDILKSVTKFLPLIKGMNEEDEATALLSALAPFLSGEKSKKLEDAKKMLRILRMLPFIKSQGLF